MFVSASGKSSKLLVPLSVGVMCILLVTYVWYTTFSSSSSTSTSNELTLQTNNKLTDLQTKLTRLAAMTEMVLVQQQKQLSQQEDAVQIQDHGHIATPSTSTSKPISKSKSKSSSSSSTSSTSSTSSSDEILPPIDDSGITISGQIHLGTEFGIQLLKLASRLDVTRILEIGTWEGGGSTLCLAKGLNTHRTVHSKLVTFESNRHRWSIAKKGLSVYPFVDCQLGTAVSSISISSEEEIRSFFANRGKQYPLPGWEGYRQGEFEDASKYDHQAPLLEGVCTEDSDPFDMVLLDGGEFFGMAEFRDVMDMCDEPRFVALHDTNAFKNFDTRLELLKSNSGYKLMSESKDQTGFSIFEKKQ